MDEFDGPSKTQLKKAMQELLDLGEAMLQLSDAQLDQLITHEGLREAFRDLRRISSHGARKRQVGYVGKLLRDVDVAPFRQALAALYAGKARDTKSFHQVEEWRDRLIAEDAAWQAWVQAYPAGDTKPIRAMLRAARHEAATAADGKGRAYRELFRLLRPILQASAADTAPP